MEISEMPPWLGTGLLLAAVAVGLLAHLLLSMLLARIVSRERTPVFRAALEAARNPSRYAIVPLSMLAALPLERMDPSSEAAATRILGVVLVAALAWTLIRVIGASFDAYLDRVKVGAEGDVDVRRLRTQLIVFRRFSILGVVLLAAGLMLTAIPVVRTIGLSLFASAGVAGIVAGIAARPVLANLFAGLQIAIAQPIRIGDAVLVEGEWGHIEAITANYVVVEIWDQRRLVVPLSYFLERPFQNWTMQSPQIVQPVHFYVDYTVPIEELREQVHRILSATPLWDGRLWNLQVTDLREDKLELRALVSAANGGAAWELRCHLREEIVKFLAERYPAALPRTRIELAPSAEGAEGRAAGTARHLQRIG
jgi:small-conductance mechanosensitive channel